MKEIALAVLGLLLASSRNPVEQKKLVMMKCHSSYTLMQNIRCTYIHKATVLETKSFK